MGLKNRITDMKFAKIKIIDFGPDWIHEGRVLSRKINAFFPESNFAIALKVKRIKNELEPYKGKFSEALIHISEGYFSEKEFEHSSPCRYLGVRETLSIFPEFVEIEDDEVAGAGELEEFAANYFENNWTLPFGLSLYAENHFINTKDGILILTENIVREFNLVEGGEYHFEIKSGFISSLKKSDLS